MSRINTESNPGVQVTRSANNVYTVLLLISFLVLASASVYMGMVNSERFGFTMPFGEEYDKSLSEAKSASDQAGTQVTLIKETMTGQSTESSRTPFNINEGRDPKGSL